MAELSVRRVTRWHGVTVLLGEPYPVSERRGGRAPLPAVAVDLAIGGDGRLTAVTVVCHTPLGGLQRRPYTDRDRPGWLRHLIEQYAPTREEAGHGG